MITDASPGASSVYSIAPMLSVRNGARAVEFYDGARDHYFMTADAREIADLDDAVHPGWVRTGQSFIVGMRLFASAHRRSRSARCAGSPGIARAGT